MTSTNLPALITSTLEDMKALNITVIPVAHITSITDHMVICTGTSSRHLKAICESMRQAAKAIGIEPRSEGEQDGEWILLDLNDAVVHIMLPKARDYYNLEGLWQVDAD